VTENLQISQDFRSRSAGMSSGINLDLGALKLMICWFLLYYSTSIMVKDGGRERRIIHVVFQCKLPVLRQ